MKIKMDEFFQVEEDFYEQPTFGYGNCLPMNTSAFVPYINGVDRENSSSINVNKRMIGFMTRNWRMKMVAAHGEAEPERQRLARHMMSERTRREKEKQSYLALHSSLPSGTKNDKNSIVLTARRKIQELRSHKEALERRNRELLTNSKEQKNEKTKIEFRVSNPISGIDSMLEVLKCLKNFGTETKSIQSKFSNQELVTVMEIQTEVDVKEVEKDVQRTLHEVERKLLR